MIDFSKYSSIEIDSRKCNKNSIFIVFNDKFINNSIFINNAIENGATLILSKKKINCLYNYNVKNIYKLFYKLLNYFYPNDLKLIGVTGTDGKTTTSLMIKSLINQNNNCGYIGTNGIIFNNKIYKNKNTTPDIVTTRKFLTKMFVEGVKFVTIECSSEGILSNRLFSLKFDSIIYTNITHEHLDTHKTMKNYIDVKMSLLNRLKKSGKVFVNYDDLNLQKIKGRKVVSFGIKNGLCKAFNVKTYIDKTEFFCMYRKLDYVCIPFFGTYNVYNCLASILVLEQYNLNYNIDFMFMHKIEGRFEFIKTIDKEIVIDFAHTPNALENLLKNIKHITKKRIVLVLGAAGGKDKSKRPLLGSVANRYASDIIITSEDPKNELITDIFSDLTTLIKKEYYLVLFRKEAIKLGLSLLDNDSILVIVGKGLENYEQIYNIKFPYNDYLYTKSLLNA